MILSQAETCKGLGKVLVQGGEGGLRWSDPFDRCREDLEGGFTNSPGPFQDLFGPPRASCGLQAEPLGGRRFQDSSLKAPFDKSVVVW
jgi:hypothetical protein